MDLRITRQSVSFGAGAPEHYLAPQRLAARPRRVPLSRLQVRPKPCRSQRPRRRPDRAKRRRTARRPQTGKRPANAGAAGAAGATWGQREAHPVSAKPRRADAKASRQEPGGRGPESGRSAKPPKPIAPPEPMGRLMTSDQVLLGDYPTGQWTR